MVVAVFQHQVAVHVLYVKMSVEPEPFFIFALVFELSLSMGTPLSPRF